MQKFKNITTILILYVVSSFTTTTLAYATSRISYISIPVNTADSQWALAGKLSYPLEQQNGAAVLIVHGSGGVDTRGAYHSVALNSFRPKTWNFVGDRIMRKPYKGNLIRLAYYTPHYPIILSITYS